MTPRLSIIIVNYNGRELLRNCLASLAAHPPRTPFEIVVVDNASTDGSLDILHAWPAVRVVALDRNVGFSAGNNAGIRASSGELVLLLNNDTIVPDGALDTLVARLDAHPQAGVAGPRLVDADGRPELTWGPMISAVGELRQKMLMALQAREFNPIVRWIDRKAREERYVDWVTGACLLVRREAAERVGLLDERFFLYTEDVDFCASIRAAGWKILFTPAAEVVHLRGRARVAAPAMINRAYRRSHLAFYEKHHPRYAWMLKAYLRMKGQLPE